ncbi:MAG TPA: endonuclease III domain-containing protein [Phycisphaerales bacterium]|nr:endonuclease III domain-containing protein [Phycisphaerales bacterium]
MAGQSLMEIYELLYERFGPQHWWPGDGRFEIIVGAILTQNTNWGNVERAIANLKAAGALDPAAIHEMPGETLAGLIRPAGYFNVKAARLKSFMNWLFETYGGDVDAPAAEDLQTLRRRLLAVKGVGRETADSILLYAYDKPIFVVDAYTARVAVRHQLIDADADYEQLRELFQWGLPEDVRLFNEFHALIVRVGKEYCRPTARCAGCPLEALPHTPA